MKRMMTIMKSITSNPITDGQVKQLKRVAEDAIDAAIKTLCLTSEGAQRALAEGNQIKSTIITKIGELSTSDKFADEEVESTYQYPKGYKVKGIAEQMRILRQYFPELGNCDEKIAELPLPEGAEGYFAIPRWEKIAPTYEEAVLKVFAAIKSQRNGKFYNYRDGGMGPDYLRQNERSVRMLAEIGAKQTGETLVVAAQFGLKHRGRSVRRAREVFVANEFGLSAFAIGCMLLTHPNRLVAYEDLGVDCGDEYAPAAAGVFGGAPLFNFGGDRVEFSADGVGNAGRRFGSGSGFGSQYPEA